MMICGRCGITLNYTNSSIAHDPYCTSCYKYFASLYKDNEQAMNPRRVNGHPIEKLLTLVKSAPKGHKVPVETLIEALEVAIQLQKEVSKCSKDQ